MLVLDGSQGEGGGQILRSALALAMVTHQAVRITNIRARRKQPGLQRQHLAAVNAAAEVCAAQVQDATLHSTQLDFHPGAVRPGSYTFAIGSAGSCTLVLQTVLPGLMLATSPSQLTLTGGTHNPLAPPFEFVERTFLPVLARMGPHVSLTLERHGFYPRGGGRLRATIEPCARLQPLVLRERGPLGRQQACAKIAGLPRHIAERELSVLHRELEWDARQTEVRELPHNEGPGNVVLAEIESTGVTEVFAGFGQRGVPAEAVAQGVAAQVLAYLSQSAPVSEHLADQLILPCALAGGGEFVTGPLSSHATTNLNVVRAFLPLGVEVTPHEFGHSVLFRT